MKVQLQKLDYSQHASIIVDEFQGAYFDAPWHYHPENELVYIVSGYGRRFVADHVESFEKGDLVLIKGNVPHFWLSHDNFYQEGNTEQCYSLCIQFNDRIFPSEFQEMPEFNNVSKALAKAGRGIKVEKPDIEKVKKQMEMMFEVQGVSRLNRLYEALDMIGQSTNYKVLGSIGYQSKIDIVHPPAVSRTLDYLDNHFMEAISLTVLAGEAHLSNTALCRQFKASVGKSIFEYLNEIRVSYARKLLLNSNFSVTQIAFDAGYNSVSNFNRQFRKVVSCSPKEYKKRFIDSTKI